MKVWVQVVDNLPYRILKNINKTVQFQQANPLAMFEIMEKTLAVRSIREQVWKRQEGMCQRCGDPITWGSMHLDEIVPRGKGGEISLTNCRGLDFKCHLGPRGKHQNRQLKFTQRTTEVKVG